MMSPAATIVGSEPLGCEVGEAVGVADGSDVGVFVGVNIAVVVAVAVAVGALVVMINCGASVPDSREERLIAVTPDVESPKLNVPSLFT